jgi:hypothetical protein
MVANFSPIYGLTPQTGGIAAGVTAANTATDGTGTVSTVYTAGANGGMIRRIRVKGAGTNAASVMRVFINNGSTSTSAANNSLWGELPLPATTAANAAAIGPDLEYPMNVVLKAAYVVNICYGTAGSAGWQAIGEAIDY